MRAFSSTTGFILEQTFQDWELIILDDASPDDSLAVISRYLNNRRVQLSPQPYDSGDPFLQWAKGLSLAQGEYVWIAESDDFAAPQFLERLLSLAADHPSAGILYCQSCMVDEDGRNCFAAPHYEGLDDSKRWTPIFLPTQKRNCPLLFDS